MSQQVSRDTRAGIAYMLLGIVLLPVMNAIAKSLTADYPLTQVVWARFWVISYGCPCFSDRFSASRYCGPVVPRK